MWKDVSKKKKSTFNMDKKGEIYFKGKFEDIGIKLVNLEVFSGRGKSFRGMMYLKEYGHFVGLYPTYCTDVHSIEPELPGNF